MNWRMVELRPLIAESSSPRCTSGACRAAELIPAQERRSPAGNGSDIHRVACSVEATAALSGQCRRAPPTPWDEVGAQRQKVASRENQAAPPAS